MVKETTTYLVMSRPNAGGTSGHVSRACHLRQMLLRSSAVKAVRANSSITSSSTRRCTSSMLNEGLTALTIIWSDRRRYSLVIAGQSAQRPCCAPACAKAWQSPVCQSRIVPPVSNVSALMSASIPSPPFSCAPLQASHTPPAALAQAQVPRHLLHHPAVKRLPGRGVRAATRLDPVTKFVRQVAGRAHSRASICHWSTDLRNRPFCDWIRSYPSSAGG